ncbi:hypothetical protein ACS0TY_030953 [Phlomoides rotata]
MSAASSSTALSILSLHVGSAMTTPDESGDDVLDLGCVEGSFRESSGSFCLRLGDSKPALALRWPLVRCEILDWEEQPSGVSITRASFWARVYDLPIMCHTEATLISIAERIGDLEVFEPPDGLNLGYYLRFKVSIDITKPLLRGLPIKLKGEKLWIPIKYEALPYYCFCCGLVGHNFRGCDSYDKNDYRDPTEMEYGPFLKASSIKKGDLKWRRKRWGCCGWCWDVEDFYCSDGSRV